MTKLYGGIEAGGTKFVCAVGSGPDHFIAEERFPTTTPEETIARSVEFFKKHDAVAAIGIGSFGPVDPDPKSPTFGFITTTPKPGWANVDFAGKIRDVLGVPVNFDTDVNAAALGEYRYGAAQGLDCFVYFTIGTGIGGGGVINGRPMHGLVHPEMGHIRVPHDLVSDPYKGCCPYHSDCFEGLACGTAIGERWGQSAETLPVDHPAWELEARYIALGMHNMICTLSPRRIILGGGVMDQEQLFPLVRKNVLELLNGYVQSPAIIDRIDDFIVPPALGNKAGVLGSIALAQM